MVSQASFHHRMKQAILSAFDISYVLSVRFSLLNQRVQFGWLNWKLLIWQSAFHCGIRHTGYYLDYFGSGFAIFCLTVASLLNTDLCIVDVVLTSDQPRDLM